MATNLEYGESVYVPCSRVAGLNDLGVSLYRTVVEEVDGKKIRVRLRNGNTSEQIGKSLVHREVGILVVNVGDFLSEAMLLDPLAKSVTQFCKLLVPDDQIRSVRIRSVEELRTFWAAHQAVYSHVIWVGHGRETGLKFGVDGWVDAETLGQVLRIHGAPRKVYISLSCNSGYKSFGAALSKTAICSDFVGPFQSVEGAVASQFCQTFLALHLLQGRTTGVAFNNARQSVPGGVSFRLWRAGKLKAGPS